MGRHTRKYVWLALVLALAAVLVGALHFGPRLFYARLGFLILGPKDGGLSPAQKQKLRSRLGGLEARIAWSSSRGGNHELYLLDTSDMSLTQLTRSPEVDYFPRFSPDGRSLVFARSQREWASERDLDAYDAWVLDLASGRESLAARGANFPQWVDGGRISFLRGTQVVVKDLAAGREQIVFDGQDPPIRGRIATPELCPADPGKLALTAFGRVRGVAVVELGTKRLSPLGPGCEASWFPDGKRLLWVGNQGAGRVPPGGLAPGRGAARGPHGPARRIQP